MTKETMGQLKVQFECADCGPVQVIDPRQDNASECVLCASCGGQIISIDDLNAEMSSVGRAIAIARLRGEPDTAQFSHPRLKRG